MVLTSEKKPWEKYLLPNPHTERLKFYNSVVPQIYESSFVSKQAGFKQYLLEQQQMRWQLNTKIKALSDKENNLLRNENWGVCQNITKFMSGVDGCKGSGDVAKCESSLTTVNEAFNSASDLLSFIDNRRKNLYTDWAYLKVVCKWWAQIFPGSSRASEGHTPRAAEGLQCAHDHPHELEEKVPISHGEQRPIPKKKRKQEKSEKNQGEKVASASSNSPRKTYLKRGS